MKSESFEGGIQVIAAALQGEFDAAFLALVQEKFQTVEEDVWAEMIELLCRSPKRARDLVLNDFLRAMTDTYAHRRAMEKRMEHAEAERLRNGCTVPFHEIVGKIVAAKPTPYLRELNLSLQAHVKQRRGETLNSEERAALNRTKGWAIVPPAPPAPPVPDPAPEERPSVEELGKAKEEDWKW